MFFLYLPHRLVPADIANFQPQGLLVAADRRVPQILRLFAVENDVALLGELDLAVGVPLALGRGAVEAEVFNQLQPVLADEDFLKRLFLRRAHTSLVVELGDLLRHAVADKAVNGNDVALEQRIVCFVNMESHLVADHNVVQHVLQVA